MYLEVEQQQIEDSIVRVIQKNDIRYLLPNAYKFLCRCSGFRAYKNWDEFTDRYNATTLMSVLFEQRTVNVKNPKINIMYSRLVVAVTKRVDWGEL